MVVHGMAGFDYDTARTLKGAVLVRLGDNPP